MDQDRSLERRLVTSLFLDVVGSTDLMMRIPPERLKRVLDDAFAELSALMTDHGGTIEKYLGDAIFAVFGVPVAHADDAVRALRAAEACAAWVTKRGGERVPLAIRIGIETGHVLVNAEVPDQGGDRMIVGPSVNLAARLQTAAEPNQIVVGPVCREAASDQASFEPLGELELKGIGRVPGWRLVATTGAGGTSTVPFVGRHSELELLRSAFRQTSGGRSVLALVIGPPGQGKSRLVTQFLETLDGASKLIARCRPEAEQGALTPLRQLLADGGSHPSSASVLTRMAELFVDVDERNRVASALMHSAGLPGAPEPLPTNPVDLQDEVLNGWRRYLSALSSRELTVIWIEDLHWAEPQLVRLVDRLTSGSDMRLLVIGTARPEFLGHASLRPGGERSFIELAPLDQDEATELARHAGALDDAAIARAAGNPLFLLELARSRRAGSDEIPVTVEAAIAARIDELARSDRDVLQRAAVVGETFDLRDVALLTGRDTGEVSGTLGRLAHAGYITTVERSYRYHHPLVHDVAYGRLTLVERMHLHAQYAQDGVNPDDVEALAHHWWRAVGGPDAEWVWENEQERGRLRQQAYRAHLAAGQRHSDRFAQERAVEVLDRALELASGPEERAVVERALGLAYARNAQGDAAWEHRMRAIAAYREAGLTPPASLYAETIAIPVFNYAFTRSMPDEEVVTRILADGVDVARASADDASLARLLVLESFYMGDPVTAAKAFELVESVSDARPYADTLVRLAIVQMMNGDAAGSDRTFRRAEELMAAGADVDELEYLAYRPTSHLLMGRRAEATSLADRFLKLTQTMGVHLRTHALQARSSAAVFGGEWDLALDLARQIVRIVQSNPATPYCIRGAMAAAQGAVAAQMVDDRESAEELVEVTERMIKPGLQLASALFLPHVMLGLSPDPHAAIPAPGTVTRPWQRQLVDPVHINVALGAVIGQRKEAGAPVLQHLEAAAANGSPTAAALIEAINGNRASLEALRFDGLVQVLGYEP